MTRIRPEHIRRAALALALVGLCVAYLQLGEKNNWALLLLVPAVTISVLVLYEIHSSILARNVELPHSLRSLVNDTTNTKGESDDTQRT